MESALTHFGMDDETSAPKQHTLPPLLLTQSAASQYQWLKTQASSIRENLFDNTHSLDILRASTIENDIAEQEIQAMLHPDGTYLCSYCNAKYKIKGWLIRHLERQHDRQAPQPAQQHQEDTTAKSVTLNFVKMALLARDTWDAYRMADGDRVFRNAKFEFLYAFGTGRTKYRWWLWNMLAYEHACLTEREAFEYRWNIAATFMVG